MRYHMRLAFALSVSLQMTQTSFRFQLYVRPKLILVTCLRFVAFLLLFALLRFAFQLISSLRVVHSSAIIITIIIIIITMLATTSLRRLTAAPLVQRTTFRAFAAASGSHKVVTLEELDDVTKFRQDNPKSVLYFTATWCPPCKQIKPIYHDLSTTTESVAFGLVDVDDNQDAAVEFQISAVPTFIFSQGQDTMERLAGADPHNLQKHLAALKDA